ncbi:MAG TPA: XdhC family protein [Desulfobulbus sp.]|nr:XdhC family protein [Desulfobulbus sp.]
MSLCGSMGGFSRLVRTRRFIVLCWKKIMEIYRKITELLDSGGVGALVTLVGVEGSGPRAPGTKMVVVGGRVTAGTIGGGRLEQEMIRLAAEVSASGQARLVTYAENGENGLACGGRATVFLEPLQTGNRLLVIGCGHVGRALARLAVDCALVVTVLDDRKEIKETDGRFLLLENYDDPFADLDIGKRDMLVIAGRSHAVDLQVLRAALSTRAGFIGLLGSKKKKDAFFATLRKEGVPDEQLARVRCPVGLPIGAHAPAEIAVSIMAQLIAYQNNL